MSIQTWSIAKLKRYPNTLLLLGLLAILPWACQSDKTQALGNITFINGQAWLLSTSSDGSKEKEIKTGAKVFKGDQIRTGEESAVELELHHYGLLRVGENTVFKLSELDSNKKVEVRVDEGKAGLFINQLPPDRELIVSTPTLIAGVRGTRFLVGSDKTDKEAKSKIALFDGSLQLSNGNSKMKLDKPGEIKAHKGMRLSPELIEPISPESIAEMKALETMNSKPSPGKANIQSPDIKKPKPAQF